VEELPEVVPCACLTGSDKKWPEVALFGSMLCMHMHNRKLRNIRPSGAFFTGIDKFTWPEEALSGLTFCFRTFFPVLFLPYFFSIIIFPYFFLYFFFRTFFPYFFYCTLFPVFFSCTILSYFFSRTSPPPRTFFPVLFFPALSSRTFSKVATFEIERFKISVSCFSSTCRYNAVHVPCGISIQTSPVGLPLDGWGARMRDLKGPKMNLFNLKEDWNVL
jgi:hypothetical protein